MRSEEPFEHLEGPVERDRTRARMQMPCRRGVTTRFGLLYVGNEGLTGTRHGVLLGYGKTRSVIGSHGFVTKNTKP